MYIILWEYRVETEKRAEFVDVYAPNGVWADLFRKATGYLGTELLQDETSPERLLTIDRWKSKESFDAFKLQWEKEYKELDAQCEGLTESESMLGRWESL